MRNSLYALIRRIALGLFFTMAAASIIVPSTSEIAQAKRRKKAVKKHRGGGDPSRQIKKEGDLEPKKDYGLDEEITKTKEIQTNLGEQRPTLSPDELKRAEAEALMDEKLDEEIELARRLLELETDCDAASPVRFRVADLYWEKAKRAFFKANDFKTPEAERKKWDDLRKRLQSTTIKNYQKIVDECEGYKDYSKVLFYLGKALDEVDRHQEATEYFKRIIKDFPGSEWEPNAWFMIGEYYFNTANDALKAIKAYQKAATFTKSAVYGFAVYKQGWCYINTGDWDLAKERFKEVVTISEDPQNQLDHKGRLSLRKEALKDYVRAFSHVGDAKNALKHFYQLGGKDSVVMMMELLGKWYIEQGAHYDVIHVYRDLIKNYPRSTRLPIYQGYVVDAASRLNDKKATVAQVKLLTEYFQKVRERVAKGDLDPGQKDNIEKDMREAEDIAENTLRRLALEYHKEAKKLRGTAQDRTYRYALELYKHYLAVFPEPKPDADVNYVFFMRFYYAEVLYKMEQFGEAANNYDAVVDMNPHPKEEKEKQIVLAAAEESVRSYDELVQDLDRKNPPEISGTDPKPIPPIKQKLIDSCLRYIKYVGAVGDKIVEIRYKMARIYYTYNHFDKAAPAFNDIVTNHPDNSVACYSANLVLDIYNGRKDFVHLKEASHAYHENNKLACGDEDRAKFAKIEESSTFLLIKGEYEDQKKYIAAANAYLAFYKSFPKSEYADDAVYNAALNYDLGMRLDKAIEVRKFLVEKLPDSSLVPETLYNIAESYERVVDFESAAHWLELYAKRYPDDPKSKDAVYNAGLYRATLRDWAGGKAGRERYLSLYPKADDAPDVAFAICESLEEEANATESKSKRNRGAAADRAIREKWEAAHNCYYNWIKNGSYVKHDTDKFCYGQFRRGEIMLKKTHYEKGYEEQKNFLLRNWPSWKKHGASKLPRCATAVAELMFRDLEPRMKKYRDIRISELNPTDAGKKKFEASIKTKTKERDALVEQYKKVVEVGVPEWALAALFYIGELYRDSIEKLLSAPIPNKIPGYKLTDEDKQLLRNELKNMVVPIEATAVEAYQLCVSKANELGVYNKWSVRALDQLHELRPENYPMVVERLVPLDFPDELKVQTNSIVVQDGELIKPAEVRVAMNDDTSPPVAKPAKEAKGSKKDGKDSKGEGGKAAASKGKGKKGSEASR